MGSCEYEFPSFSALRRHQNSNAHRADQWIVDEASASWTASQARAAQRSSQSDDVRSTVRDADTLARAAKRVAETYAEKEARNHSRRLARMLLYRGVDKDSATPELIEAAWQRYRMFQSPGFPGKDNAGMRTDEQWSMHQQYRDQMSIALEEAGSTLMNDVFRGKIHTATRWNRDVTALHAATVVDRDVVSVLLPAFAERVRATDAPGTLDELPSLLDLTLETQPNVRTRVLYSPRGSEVEAPSLAARVVAAFRHGDAQSVSRVLCIELDIVPCDSSPFIVTTLDHVVFVGAGGARCQAEALHRAEIDRIEVRLRGLEAQCSHAVENAPRRKKKPSGDWRPAASACSVLLEMAEPLLETLAEKTAGPAFYKGQDVWYIDKKSLGNEVRARIVDVKYNGKCVSFVTIRVDSCKREVNTIPARIRAMVDGVIGGAALLARCEAHVARMRALQSKAADLATKLSRNRTRPPPPSRHMEAEAVEGISMLRENIELKQRQRRCWYPHMNARNFREELEDMTMMHCTACSERWWDKRTAAVKATARVKERKQNRKSVKKQLAAARRRARGSSAGVDAVAPYLCKRCGDHRAKQRANTENDEEYDLYGASNNQLPSAVPDALKDLTNIEQMLIALASPIMNVFLLKFGQYAGRGHCVALPQDLQPLATALPRQLRDVDVFVVVSQQGRGSSALHREFTVNRARVQTALEWLIENNPYYVRVCVV